MHKSPLQQGQIGGLIKSNRENMLVLCGLWTVDCGLWTVDCGLWSVVCGLWTVDCGLWAVGCGLWAVDCGCPQIASCLLNADGGHAS